MTEFEPNDSVRKEQFGETENTENKKNAPEESPDCKNDKDTSEESTSGKVLENESGIKKEGTTDNSAALINDADTSDHADATIEADIPNESEGETIINEGPEAAPSPEATAEPAKQEDIRAEGSIEETEVTVTSAETEPPVQEAENITAPNAQDETSGQTGNKPITPIAVVEDDGDEKKNTTINTPEATEEKLAEGTDNKEAENQIETTEAAAESKYNKEEEEKIDFSKLSQDQLVNTFEILLETKPIEQAKGDLEILKSLFYKSYHADLEKKKTAFTDEGGNPEDFMPEDSPLEQRLKQLLTKYRLKRDELTNRIENTKEQNLQEKHNIIEEIKELVNSQESLNKTFQEFRDLQEQWRKIGPVHQKSVKELWEKYHFQVEAFYDYIKINKELRDLDFKKNLEAKMVLCEKSEELILEPSVVEAFRKLQKLHDQWREIGPVPSDKRTELWERFKEATTKINKRHQEYFVNLKNEQKTNLEEKTMLCEKAEEIAAQEITNAKDWDTKSKEIIELQKVWKSIGFAPRKQNTKIYERFRAACDKFFGQKRDFFSQSREDQQNNLQIKTELCMQAESLQDSTDWKKTTDDLIALQKKWKEIGPVPSKQSDKIWKRFRAACDKFFNRKSEYFSNIDSEYEENLKKKEDLIKEVEEIELTGDIQINLDTLKQFQRRYSEIGFVPIKKKDEIQNKFREAINKRYDELKIDDERKEILKFKTRIDNIANKPKNNRRLYSEREKFASKLNQLQNDIALWENNIGFFSNSKNAEQLKNDVEDKIANAKQKIKMLKEKMRIIDQSED